jgi:ribosomal protein S7
MSITFQSGLTNLGPVLDRLRTRIGGTKINIPMEVPQQVMMSLLYDSHTRLQPDG